jgi:hypothetical protein
MVFNREQSLSTVHLKIFYYFRHFFEDLDDVRERKIVLKFNISSIR